MRQSIVNNQVLPLLKPTFGGAFTVQEGDALKATLGDPDASPEQKVAQLNSFIDAKEREIQTKERELGVSAEVAAPTAATPTAGAITLPNGIVVRQVQ